MSVNLSPFAGAGAQFFTDAGTPLTGGLLYTYAAGTTTPATTYTDYAGSVANSNPIVLDAAGRVPYEIWLTAGSSYKFILKTSVGTTIGTWDNIDGVNDVAAATAFYADAFTTTAGQTTFTLSANPGSINNLNVSLDGATLVAGDDFTWTGTTLVLSMAAYADQRLRVAYSSVAGVKAISPGSVVDASVAAGTKLYNRINDIVDVKDYGAVGDGVTDDTAAVQAAITAATSGTTVVLAGGVYKVTGILFASKSNIKLVGPGTIDISGAASGAFAIQMSGTCDNLEFADFSIVGANNAAYFQTGVGNNSGQTLSRIRCLNLNVTGVNVGLSFTGNGGSCLYSKAIGNVVSNIPGTASGQGYGLHIDNAQYCEFIGNTVNNASRHSIYHGRGSDNSILLNTVINHRSTVAAGIFRCAIVVSRSSRVKVLGNKVINAYDGCLEISPDTSLSLDCTDIMVQGNEFENPQNAIYPVIIGEQTIPTSYRAKNITLIGNKFVAAYSAIGTNAIVQMFNVQGLTIHANDFNITGVTSTCRVIGLGYSTYNPTSNDCTETSIVSNRFRVEGTTLTDVRCIDVDSNACTNSSVHFVGPNVYSGVTYEAYPQATITNTNLQIRFTTLQGSAVYDPPNLADGAGTTTTVTCTGATLGDFAQASFSNDLQGITVTSYVSSANTVSVRFQNESGGALDLANGTLRVYVQRRVIQ